MTNNGGKREGAGRKVGSIGKRSKEIEEKLKKMQCDPIAGMARIAMQSEHDANNSVDAKDVISHRQIAGKMYSDLAQYVASRRKSVEHTVDNSNKFVDMTSAQRYDELSRLGLSIKRPTEIDVDAV